MTLGRVRRQRQRSAARDTEATAFTALLADLIRRLPGARAAALVDGDGESVDYAGSLSPFDVKIAAAHLRIVLGELESCVPLCPPQHVVIRGTQKTFVIRALGEAYAVVVVLSSRAGFASSPRAFHVFEHALREEAGIGAAPKEPLWTAVTVEQDARSRPFRVASSSSGPAIELEVLGAVMGLEKGERGFRVRLADGVETTLVRETSGAWYADEPMARGPKKK